MNHNILTDHRYFLCFLLTFDSYPKLILTSMGSLEFGYVVIGEQFVILWLPYVF